RTRRWKLVRDFDHFIKDELYDLVSDPAEKTNLIDSPEPDIQDVCRSLNTKLLDKMRGIDDPALKEAKS
ncbi:MAG: N-acetylgalactosamine-6-sulfatase, partial [Planctomycetota bacterium]